MNNFSFYTSKARSLENTEESLNEMFKQIVQRDDVEEQFYNQKNLDTWCDRVNKTGEVVYSFVKDMTPHVRLIPKLRLSFVGKDLIPMIELVVSELEFYAYRAMDYVYESITCGEIFARLVEHDELKLSFAQQPNVDAWKERVTKYGKIFYIVNRDKCRFSQGSPRLVLAEVGPDRAPTIEFNVPYRTFGDRAYFGY